MFCRAYRTGARVAWSKFRGNVTPFVTHVGTSHQSGFNKLTVGNKTVDENAVAVAETRV
jgi:hypothetical protein